MTFEKIKNFLKVDFNADDEYIQLLIDVADKYVAHILGKNYDKEDPRVKLMKLTLISTMYQNREYTVPKGNEEVQYTLRTIKGQLELEADDE